MAGFGPDLDRDSSLEEEAGREFWTGDARSFARDKQLNSFYALRATQVAETLAGLPRESRVLDLGCGTGWLANALALRGHEVTALDLSASQVERAGRLAAMIGAKLDLHVGGIEAISDEARFEAVCAVGVLPYIANQRRFLRQLAGHVAPRGWVVVSETRAVSLFTLVALLRHFRRFRFSRTWFVVARNLLNTGVWSGGFVQRDTSAPLHGSHEFAHEMAALGFTATTPVCLYGFAPLDRAPRHRGPLAQWLAEYLCWCVLRPYFRNGDQSC